MFPILIPAERFKSECKAVQKENEAMKKWKKLMIIPILLISVTITSVADSFVVSATSNTQQKIDEAEREKQEWEQKKNETDQEIDQLKSEQGNLRKELNNLNAKLTEVVAHLEELEGKIREKEQEIEVTQAALEEARATESRQYDCMVQAARYMYERKEESTINSLLLEGSLAKLLNAADYIEMVASYQRKKMDEFKETRAMIEEQEACLQQEKLELDDLKVEAEAEKSKVAGLISQTSNSISKYADQISEEEEKARAYEAEIKKKEEDLKYLKKKLAEEIALSQAAANAKWRDISEVTFADGDRKLLANLIYCEAGGEPYAGQLAVGSVVINRVLSSKFPDSVVGVIYSHRQFSPVASGRLDLALAADKATANCYKAADEAMSGITNVGNCVFFRTPIEGLTGISIGGHIFY